MKTLVHDSGTVARDAEGHKIRRPPAPATGMCGGPSLKAISGSCSKFLGPGHHKTANEALKMALRRSKKLPGVTQDSPEGPKLAHGGSQDSFRNRPTAEQRRTTAQDSSKMS